MSVIFMLILGSLAMACGLWMVCSGDESRTERGWRLLFFGMIIALMARVSMLDDSVQAMKQDAYVAEARA